MMSKVAATRRAGGETSDEAERTSRTGIFGGVGVPVGFKRLPPLIWEERAVLHLKSRVTARDATSHPLINPSVAKLLLLSAK